MNVFLIRLFVISLLFSCSPKTKYIHWDLNEIYAIKQSELIEAKNVTPFPNEWIESYENVISPEHKCFHNFSNIEQTNLLDLAEKQPNLKKLILWNKFKCNYPKQIELPQNFFSTPPFIHPLGGSWVAYVYTNANIDFFDQAWLNSQKKYLHILEYSLLSESKLDLSELIFTKLQPYELSLLVNKIPNLKNKYFEFTLLPSTAAGKYQVQTLGIMGYFNRNWMLISLLTTLLVFASTITIVYFRIKLLKKNIQKDRELIMQTLAHEIRHPATSLQLSLETFRDNFDQLPEQTQMEFLRMCDQVQKLNKVIHASKQYLLFTAKEQKPIEFQETKILSLNNFIEDVLYDYKSKIQLNLVEEDISVTLDPYWVSMCITNLVKNSLAHGLKPIEVVTYLEANKLVITVTDQGPGSALNFSQMTTPFKKNSLSSGMGLGLSLVERISKLMGGGLEYSFPPTCFTLSFEVKRENCDTDFNS